MLCSTCLFGQDQNKDTQYPGYLFAYFEGKSDPMKREYLRFATSSDGIKWKAMHNNFPVIASDTISSTGGIRDPHLLRGHDKGFYMVATDMKTFKDGWDTNPGIILMYSDDLAKWKHKIINLEQSYPKKFKNVKWVWAPQTFYDTKKGKYLVYFTVRYHHNEKLDFYAAYANKDFTGFESEPKLLFSPKFGGIDGDIIFDKGTYHFFYKGNTKDENGKEFKNGIKVATSKSLWGPWKENEGYLDSYAGTNTKVEGSSIFKLNNSDEYLLMYDVYSDGRYEFQRSKDLATFTEKPESFTKNFDPRHGSIISITKDEARALDRKWGGYYQS